MKKIVIVICCIVLFGEGFSQDVKSSFGKQMWKNLHLKWDTDNADDYKWRNIALGTGYGRTFDELRKELKKDYGENYKFLKKAYWYVGADLNWGKYTLYKSRLYNQNPLQDIIIKTTSFSVPAYLGYHLKQSTLLGYDWKVYTGPVFEYIFSAKQDGFQLPVNGLDANPLQFGWTIGTGVRFLYILGFNVAYSYYPTPVLNNGNLIRSSVNFSLGF